MAGCLRRPGQANPPSAEADDGVGPPPPLADWSRLVPSDLERYGDRSLSGGVSQDGIPSIDEPTFWSLAEVNYEDADPVFGLLRNGVAKAYPQRVLVHHEIVNDEIGGEPVSVTYCPLTGTAQGFRRGETEFGVTGSLVNSNLIMYDRETESWWPQMLATAVGGPHTGNVLQEFEVTWTTFGRWAEAHPDSTVLSIDTGYLRDYDDDPYGSYNPLREYYRNDRIVFEVFNEDDRLHPKAVVIGARTADAAVAVEKDRLREAGLLTTSSGGTTFAVVHEPTLDTAIVYRDPGDHALGHDGDRPTVDGESRDPGDLPGERVVSFDAMWFAWAAYYPDTALERA